MKTIYDYKKVKTPTMKAPLNAVYIKELRDDAIKTIKEMGSLMNLSIKRYLMKFYCIEEIDLQDKKIFKGVPEEEHEITMELD